MIAGLDGDAAAHRALLERLSGQLRGYFKGQLSRISRGPVEAEDLVQEALIAIHTRRHTYDPSPYAWMWQLGSERIVGNPSLTRIMEGLPVNRRKPLELPPTASMSA
jgi:DNA-directed RNA polymerase specialized sigma24 family protein